ncbi:hypothetical protein [Chitinophaga sp. LS1]|uniref:hypothetical protein n=1 Tax=Chitinophaga sp. LS1 TaxID=3051176 RepID=UPI002AAA8BF0|nr:hypothetical protein [Chitinophaga sp. LS1]WPV68112.1 hypothetical protein QQL36_05170 [Chitinophaga sp. LS1]
MNFVRFIAEFINPNILGYRKLLIKDFQCSPAYARMLNKLFYSNFSFQQFIEWHEKTNIINFDIIRPRSREEKHGNYCRLEDLDLFEYDFKYIKYVNNTHFQFFRQDQYPSFQLAADSLPCPYFLIRKDFVNYLDELIFSSLPDFKKNKKSSQFEKELFEGVSIIFDKKRNDMQFSDIVSYFFPDLLFKINGKTIKCNLHTDLSSFTFGRKTFPFFYSQIVQIKEDENHHGFVDFDRSEPFVVNEPGSGLFLVTNSQEVIDRSNKFILLVAELFLHYYTVFEKWATEFLRQNYTKIISHPEF